MPAASTFGSRYELRERIGRGGTGDVFRAREHSAFGFPRDVCIKRLAGRLDAESTAAMREEARVLSSVRHSNVVSLLDMGEETARGGSVHRAPFLVLEHIDGFDLRTLSRASDARAWRDHAGYLPDRVAVHVACALLRALAAVQRALPGLVHRDVTPHNILVSREGEVKLTDFGIALALDRARWTRPAFVKGKVGYMAPEQIRGEPLDVRTDLFAVGVVLFELLARRRPGQRARPADASQSMEELWAVERGSIVCMRDARPLLETGLGDAVDRLLSWRIGERYASADDALRALAPFSAGDLGSLRLAVITNATEPRPR